MKALQVGDPLPNGAAVLHFTPGADGVAEYVFAAWDGRFVSWRTPLDLDGNVTGLTLGRFSGQDFDKGWSIYCLRAGITTYISREKDNA
ncbi:hypothetical protein SAMN05216276_1008163 [Streptosporangium subroseum]|uniref:Uncharacterized protein n=1 Tax=Streptosporangium subroseum TaxID=106412 RepID=A0A239E0L3_9ACTN|nr:hypothetical protein [Streptosporangium subroseum]SNS38137.1 hypothetical protein SAMN05216276_1008163 [Streptosporangium subroseum]